MSDKSLMTELNSHARNIDKNTKHFGPKLPSGNKKEEDLTLQELSYDQMIMGTLASLVWGIKNITKDTQVKSLLGKTSIFSFVKDIKDSSKDTITLIKNIDKITTINKQILAGIIDNNKKQLNEIIELLSKDSNNVNNSSQSSNIVIDFKNTQNISEVTKLIEDISDGKLSDKNKFAGLNSIVELFTTLSSVSFDKINKQVINNLKVLEDIISHSKKHLEEIFSVVDELAKNKDVEKYKYVFSSLESITKIFDMIIHFDDDLPMSKIISINIKTSLLCDTIKSSIGNLIIALSQINSTEESVNKLENLETVFEQLVDIYHIIPGLRESFHEGLKIGYVSHNIDLIGLLINTINDLPKFNRSQTLTVTLPTLFDSLFTLLENKEKSKWQDINSSLLFINETFIPNVFEMILALNSIPKMTKSLAWKHTLNEILKEFDTAENDSLANILVYKLNKGTMDDIVYFSNIIVSLSNLVQEINSIDKINTKKIDALLTVTKSIVEQFNEDNKESIASNFANINDEDIEKIASIIKILEKLSTLNKIKIVITIGEKTVEAIENIGKAINSFVEHMAEVDKDKLEEAKEKLDIFSDSMMSVAKIAVGGILILIGVTFLMQYINYKELFKFVITLGLFMLGLCGIFKLLSKYIDESMKYVKDAAIFVAVCAGVLIFASLAYKMIDWKNLFLFLLQTAIFVGFIVGICMLLQFVNKAKLLEQGLKSFILAATLVAIAGVMLILASEFYNNINLLDAFLFIAAAAAVVVVIGGLCWLLNKFKADIIIGAFLMAGIMVLLIIAGAIMEYMYLIYSQDNFYDTILNGIKLMGIIFGSFLAVIAILGAVISTGIGGLALAGAIAALYLIEELVLEATKIMNAMYYSLNNFKNLNMSKQDVDNLGGIVESYGELINRLISSIDMTTLIQLKFFSDSLTPIANSIGAIARSLKEFATLRIPVGIDANGNPKGYVTIADKDFETAQKNIGAVLTCIFDAVLGVAKTHPALFDDHLFTDSPAMNAAKVAQKMGSALTSIAKGVQDFANLKMATSYDPKTGEPRNWIRINGTIMRAASENIKKVLICINEGLLKVAKEKPELFDDHLFTDSPAMNAAKVAKKMGDAITSIAKGIQDFANLKMATSYDPQTGEPRNWVRINTPIMNKAAENIKNVLICIGDALNNTIKDRPDLFKDGIVTDSPAMNAAKTLGVMGDVITNTALAIGAYSTGKIPTYDKDGKLADKKDWVEIDLNQLTEDGPVAKAIEAIMTCLGNSLNAVVENEDNKWMFDESLFTDSPAMNAAKSLSLMSEGLNNTVNILKTFTELKLDDIYAALDPNSTDKSNVYNRINDLMTFVSELFMLFAGENSKLATTGRIRHTFWFDEKDVKMSFAQYVAENADIVEEANEALNKFAGIFQPLIENFGKLGKVVNDNKNNLSIFMGGGQSKICVYISHTLSAIYNIVKLFANENRLKLYESVEDNANDLIKGIKTITSICVSLLNGVTNVKNAFKRTDDFKFNELVEIIKSFNLCIEEIRKIKFDDDTIGSGNMTLFESNSLDAKIKAYANALDMLITINNKSATVGSEGYNVLKDGILTIYSATQQIEEQETFKQHVKELKEYVEVINSISLTRIGYLTNFVKAMNDLSKRLGNLDELTDAIGNKLSAVLYELVLQLRKAEATITNAHELQEKRKKLMEESMTKIERIMNQHMIVEISQKDENEERRYNEDKSGGSPTVTPSPSNNGGGSENTSGGGGSSKGLAPEETNAADGVKQSTSNLKDSLSFITDPLTYEKFVQFMNKNFSSIMDNH